ncbi:NAD(P)H-dependent oxidoreductase [uncultured Shewanella sp.]|uniref:NAD(P)H-dependent oxidoreductase n=1 Tax=uncultured Shewanella sp. TaxID=173975 RepID=UPI002638D2A3|nr:NAD(P)H-dependent oxidoreductase [uncultured Shewanella sp.]
MTKKILVLNGNPKSRSYCQHLAELYAIQANEYFDIRQFNLSNMVFNPSLDFGYDAIQVLEPCLSDFQQAIQWAEHIVIVTPIWWGGIPAKLKGLFDRTFLPGFAFNYIDDNPFPVRLLQGKTARIIMTMDTPSDGIEEQAAPVIAQLDRYTLQFSGIEKAALTLLGSIILAEPNNEAAWENEVQALGRKGS